MLKDIEDRETGGVAKNKAKTVTLTDLKAKRTQKVIQFYMKSTKIMTPSTKKPITKINLTKILMRTKSKSTSGRKKMSKLK